MSVIRLWDSFHINVFITLLQKCAVQLLIVLSEQWSIHNSCFVVVDFFSSYPVVFSDYLKVDSWRTELWGELLNW